MMTTFHRQHLHAVGLRPVQFWVHDTHITEFVAQVREQCRHLKDAAAEADVLVLTRLLA